MASEGDLHAVSRMLVGARPETARVIAQERIICGSTELQQALDRIEKALEVSSEGARTCRIALFSDDQGECSMIAAAMTERAEGLGFATTLTRGEWGRWAREVRAPENTTRTIHVLAGVPPEQKAREGFAGIPGNLLLLWPLDMAGAALLPEQVEELILPPFAQRALDKVAHLIEAVIDALEASNDAAVDSGVTSSLLLRSIDAGALLAVCVDPTKLKDIDTTRLAGRRLADALSVHAALRFGEPMSAAEVHRGLFPQGPSLPPNLRRLWVEGDTDATLFKLAARLAREAYPSEQDMLASIKIEPLGGAAQVEAALQCCDRDPKLELFLFDNDADGSRGAEKAKKRGFPALLLEREAVMAACDAEWVIEDLLSVACVDRFYSTHPQLKPAREEIAHHPIAGRRLVVRGEDKGQLAEWLENNARAEDVFGIIHQLLSIRRRFALREPALRCKAPEDGRSGLRPQPWWFIFNKT